MKFSVVMAKDIGKNMGDYLFERLILGFKITCMRIDIE